MTINVFPGLDGSTAERKVFTFYESCLAFNESSKDSPRRLLDLLRGLGEEGERLGLSGWPVSEPEPGIGEPEPEPMTQEVFQDKLERLHFTFNVSDRCFLAKAEETERQGRSPYLGIGGGVRGVDPPPLAGRRPPKITT